MAHFQAEGHRWRHRASGRGRAGLQQPGAQETFEIADRATAPDLGDVEAPGPGFLGHEAPVEFVDAFGRLLENPDTAHVGTGGVFREQRPRPAGVARHEARHLVGVGGEKRPRLRPRGLGPVQQPRGRVHTLAREDAPVHELLAPFGGRDLLDHLIERGVVLVRAVLAHAQHQVEHGIAGDVFDGVGRLAALELAHRLLDPGHGFQLREPLRRLRHVVEKCTKHAYRIQIARHVGSGVRRNEGILGR
ncbi:hypothetical protein D9M69_515140 [compost metagenome]